VARFCADRDALRAAVAGDGVLRGGRSLLFAFVPAEWKEFSDSVQSQQLAGNGIRESFRAFNTNEIDYDRVYLTLAPERAFQELRDEFVEAGPVQFTGHSARQDRPAARTLPHSDADPCAEAYPACAHRDDRVADRRGANHPRPA
jgi:hypothetical protein